MKVEKKADISNRLLLVDGTNVAYRAKYKFQLSNKGIDVSVTYGFLKMIIPLIREYKVSSVIVAWDGGIPKFRKEFVPEYKADRHKDEDPEERKDFRRQIWDLHDHALPAMGIVSIMKHRTEADDIIYHAAKLSACPVIVVSGDKDLLQCVSDTVSVFNPSRGKLYTPEMLEEEIGIDYRQYVNWRAIQGDSSDSIPGVNGIGEKTATKLFQTYGSLIGIENAVLGVNPKGSIDGRLKDSILSFGHDRLLNNVKTMALFRDRCGVRQCIYEEVEYFQPASKVRMMNYMMKNGFASLVDIIPGLTSKLVKPELNLGERYPTVVQERKPYDNNHRN